MFSCLRAACLASVSLDRPLTVMEQVSHASHLAICRHCRLHRRQISALQQLVRHSSVPGLPAEVRDRISAVLKRSD